MTITQHPGGVALFFSRTELRRKGINPRCPSYKDILTLTVQTLTRARYPVPPAPAVEVFPSPHGVLLFVRQQATELQNTTDLFVTFS